MDCVELFTNNNWRVKHIYDHHKPDDDFKNMFCNQTVNLNSIESCSDDDVFANIHVPLGSASTLVVKLIKEKTIIDPPLINKFFDKSVYCLIATPLYKDTDNLNIKD